jgi:DNA adenine methylase
MSYSGLGMRAGGPIGGINQTSSYDVGCRYKPDIIIKKIKRIKEHLVLSKVKVTSEDFDILIQDDTEKAFIYLDPPYFDKGGDLYSHSFSILDHERLSTSLRKTKHDWLLSYDDSTEVRKMYSWAEIISFDASYSITSVKTKEGTRNGTRKTELLIRPVSL